MRIIHTSDTHLHAPLTSIRLSPERARERKRELLSSFQRLVEEAVRLDARAMIIAGDLFDTGTVPERVMKSVADMMKSHPDIAFYYLPGNHEKNTFLPLCRDLPNVLTFGETFTTYDAGDGVTVSGRTVIGKEQWGELSLSKDTYNIVIMHGDAANKTAEHTVGLSDASEAGVDYLALGHYHFYREMPMENDGVAVYCGTPEGRGFDETEDKGYVLIDTDARTHKFVPFAKRRIFDLSVDITGAESDGEVLEAVRHALFDVRREDIVRIRLTGCHSMRFSPDAALVSTHFEGGFYGFYAIDQSHLRIVPEEYRYDRSLKGEFIRTVLEDATMDDATKEAVLAKGLAALTGGIV